MRKVGFRFLKNNGDERGMSGQEGHDQLVFKEGLAADQFELVFGPVYQVHDLGKVGQPGDQQSAVFQVSL